MSQSVECGDGESFASQDFRPVLEGKIRGDDHALPLVGRADDIEQQFGARLAGRYISELIQHQQLLFSQLTRQPQQSGRARVVTQRVWKGEGQRGNI